VLLALAEGAGIGWSAIEVARRRKLLKRGGFTLGRLYETAGSGPVSLPESGRKES